MDELLDGGWAGAAAEAFGAGWVDWCAAADEVLAALTRIGVLLERTHADLTSADLDSDQSLAALATRLG